MIEIVCILSSSSHSKFIKFQSSRIKNYCLNFHKIQSLTTAGVKILANYHNEFSPPFSSDQRYTLILKLVRNPSPVAIGLEYLFRKDLII